MRVLHTFAGAGGSHIAGSLLRWESVGSIEVDPFCQNLLRKRFPTEVVHGDIRTFNGMHLTSTVDGIVGGFPCQDISSAGNGAGITGSRSGLWKHMARIIKEINPWWVLIENSPLLASRGLNVVLSDLSKMRFDAEWLVSSAKGVGAPHLRKRMFILAYSPVVFRHRGRNNFPFCPESEKEPESGNRDWSVAANRMFNGRERHGGGGGACSIGQWWPRCAETVLQSDPLVGNSRFPQPLLRRVDARMANRVDRLRAIGNGWCPEQAAISFIQLWHRAMEAVA